MLILVFSVIQVALISSLLIIKLTGNLIELYEHLLISLSACTIILIIIGYPVFTVLTNTLKRQINKRGTALAIQTQFYLHFVILAFMILDQFQVHNFKAMLKFAPYIITFFLTAVITWHSCYAVLKSKIYQFFTLGSTALLVWSTILLLLGLLYKESFLSEKLHFILVCYFTLHFAELGFVLYIIKNNLNSISHSIEQP